MSDELDSKQLKEISESSSGPMDMFSASGFALLQRMAKAFSASTMVPEQYKAIILKKNAQGGEEWVENPNAMSNCIIALDMAQRMRSNPLMIMQNLYIVHGMPGWSAKYLIATVNTSGRFSALRYEWRGKAGNSDYGCRAWAIEKATGERLDGIWVDWAMVKAEGWDQKRGSKWKTMSDQMFIYRAATFWSRQYAPELSMGLQTAEEIQDTFEIDVTEKSERAPITMPKSKVTETVDTTTGEVTREPDTVLTVSESQINTIRKQIDIAQCDEKELCFNFGVEDIKQLPIEKLNDALNWIAKNRV